MERCIIGSRIFFKLDFFSDFGVYREIHYLSSIIGAVAEFSHATRFPDEINIFSLSVFFINKLYFLYIGIKRGAAKLRWMRVGGLRSAFFSFFRPNPTGQRIVSHIFKKGNSSSGGIYNFDSQFF